MNQEWLDVFCGHVLPNFPIDEHPRFRLVCQDLNQALAHSHTPKQYAPESFQPMLRTESIDARPYLVPVVHATLRSSYSDNQKEQLSSGWPFLQRHCASVETILTTGALIWHQGNGVLDHCPRLKFVFMVTSNKVTVQPRDPPMIVFNQHCDFDYYSNDTFPDVRKMKKGEKLVIYRNDTFDWKGHGGQRVAGDVSLSLLESLIEVRDDDHFLGVLFDFFVKKRPGGGVWNERLARTILNKTNKILTSNMLYCLWDWDPDLMEKLIDRSDGYIPKLEPKHRSILHSNQLSKRHQDLLLRPGVAFEQVDPLAIDHCIRCPNITSDRMTNMVLDEEHVFHDGQYCLPKAECFFAYFDCPSTTTRDLDRLLQLTTTCNKNLRDALQLWVHLLLRVFNRFLNAWMSKKKRFWALLVSILTLSENGRVVLLAGLVVLLVVVCALLLYGL